MTKSGRWRSSRPIAPAQFHGTPAIGLALRVSANTEADPFFLSRIFDTRPYIPGFLLSFQESSPPTLLLSSRDFQLRFQNPDQLDSLLMRQRRDRPDLEVLGQDGARLRQAIKRLRV